MFRTQSQSAQPTGGRYRPASAPWMTRALKKFARAARRQAPVLFSLIIVGLLWGAGYHLLADARPVTAYGGGVAFGLIAGMLLGMGREFGRNAIGISSFGAKSRYAILGAAPELGAEVLRDLAPDQRTPLGCLLHQPAATFASAFRDLDAALTGKQLVAFIGAAPEEGATTTALAVAISAAQQGRRVIAVDCDMRRRSLTRAIDANPPHGLLDAADAPARWREFLVQEQETGLDVLPAALSKNPWRNLLDAGGLAALIANLREHYDLIVLDCPPALNADGAVVARSADQCVIVTTWDETPVGALNDTLRAIGRAGPQTAAVFVNRVPSRYALARS
jgi:Mrp family chromosome partitioning ATPase